MSDPKLQEVAKLLDQAVTGLMHMTGPEGTHPLVKELIHAVTDVARKAHRILKTPDPFDQVPNKQQNQQPQNPAYARTQAASSTNVGTVAPPVRSVFSKI